RRSWTLDDRAARRPHLPSRAAFAGAAAALLAIATALPFYAQSSALDAARQRLERAKDDAPAAAWLRQEIDRLAQDADFVATERARFANPLRLLASLTDAIPDDTSLDALTVQGRRLQIRGNSSDAARLIERLANSGKFAEPAFSGPVVRRAETG